MKLLLIIPQKFDGPNWGGIMTYTIELARALSKTGYSVSVLTQGNKDKMWAHRGVRYYSIAHSSPRHIAEKFFQKVTGRFMSDIQERLSWAGDVRRFLRNRYFDVIEAPEWGSSALFLLYYRKSKIVIRLHKSELQYKWENMMPITLPDYIIDMFERTCILWASAVTSPTRFMAEQYTSISFIRRLLGMPTMILPNSVSCIQGKKSKRIHILKPYLLTVGRVEIGKGSLLLARAFASIASLYPTLHLYYVGEDTFMYIDKSWQSCKAYLRAWFNRHHIVGRVHFVPRQTRQTLADYYKNCLFYIAPSRGYENASMALLEAIFYKKAVVGSTAGGIPEIVHHKKNGILFRTDDAGDLVRSILYMMDHPAFRLQCELNAGTQKKNLDINIPMYESLCRKLVYGA